MCSSGSFYQIFFSRFTANFMHPVFLPTCLLASICACWMYSQHALGSGQRNTLICRRVCILGTFSNPSLTFGDRMQLFLLPFFPPFFERAADASRRTLPGLCGAVLSILWRRAASGAVVGTTGLIEVTTSALSALCLRCQPVRPKINCYAARQDRKMSAHVRAPFAPPPTITTTTLPEWRQMFHSRHVWRFLDAVPAPTPAAC